MAENPPPQDDGGGYQMVDLLPAVDDGATGRSAGPERGPAPTIPDPPGLGRRRIRFSSTCTDGDYDRYEKELKLTGNGDEIRGSSVTT